MAAYITAQNKNWGLSARKKGVTKSVSESGDNDCVYMFSTQHHVYLKWELGSKASSKGRHCIELELPLNVPSGVCHAGGQNAIFGSPHCLCNPNTGTGHHFSK